MAKTGRALALEQLERAAVCIWGRASLDEGLLGTVAWRVAKFEFWGMERAFLMVGATKLAEVAGFLGDCAGERGLL